MSMPRSSRRKSGAALLAACLFLEGAFHPVPAVFAQAVKEPVSAALSVAPAGGASEAVDSNIVPLWQAFGPASTVSSAAGVPLPDLATAPALKARAAPASTVASGSVAVPEPRAVETAAAGRPVGSISKEDEVWFIHSLAIQLKALNFQRPEDFTKALVAMLSPAADGLFRPPLELASSLTIAAAFIHPETLPILIPWLERMSGSSGPYQASILVNRTRTFLSGSAARADSARQRLNEAILNIPGLQAQARAHPQSARILDAFLDGKRASLAAAASPAGSVGGPTLQRTTPKPDSPLRRTVEKLRRTMKFGFEPTFLDRRMDKLYGRSNEDVFYRYLDVQRLRLLKELKVELAPTTKTVDWSFRDRVGKWNVGWDPGVIELQPPPQRFETILPQMTALFRASQKAGLAPEIAFGGIYGGGGHIHLDKKIFQDNPLLLRNFLVDVHNQPYLQAILEEIGDDQAQSVRQKGDELLFRTAIAGIDGELKRTDGRLSWKKTLEYLKPLFGDDRYRDVNLDNLLSNDDYDPPTVEIRMHRAQRAPEDFRDLAEFWLYRLANLSLIKKPIPILDLDEDSLRRMRLPSVARRLWRKLVQDSRLPRPERYERFVRERFPSPLLLGPARHPRVEIRYARPHGTNGAVYEILVKDPAIRELRMGPGLKRVRLFDAPELPGRPRIGVFVHHAAKDIVPVRGVPGIKSMDLSQARKEIDSYRVLRWRKVQ